MGLQKCEVCKGLFDEWDLKTYCPEYVGFWGHCLNLKEYVQSVMKN